MTASEIMEAMAYEKVEPFHKERVDYWAKQILFSFLAVNRSAKSKPIRMKDVLAPWEVEPKNSPDQDVNEDIKQIFGGFKRGG